MTKTYESGRESTLLKDIKAGHKTIECRLNRGKFANYQPGDQVWLREDIYKQGKIVRSVPRQVLVEIEKVETYPDFKTMFESVGFKNAIPRAKNLQEAIKECYRFYSLKQEKKYEVLAIYFKIVKIN